jgi:hypothetical protein
LVLRHTRPMKAIFQDEGFEFDRLNLLGSVYPRPADVGEALLVDIGAG